MKSLLLSVWVPMLVGFVATLGVVERRDGLFLRPRVVHAHSDLAATGGPPRPQRIASLPPTFLAAAQRDVITAPSGPSAAPPALPTPAARPSQAGPPSPIQISFHRRPKFQQFDVMLTNTSGESLAISVQVVHSATPGTSQADVGIPAYGQARLGVENDLQIRAGDRVVVQCPTFADAVESAP